MGAWGEVAWAAGGALRGGETRFAGLGRCVLVLKEILRSSTHTEGSGSDGYHGRRARGQDIDPQRVPGNRAARRGKVDWSTSV